MTVLMVRMPPGPVATEGTASRAQACVYWHNQDRNYRIADIAENIRAGKWSVLRSFGIKRQDIIAVRQKNRVGSRSSSSRRSTDGNYSLCSPAGPCARSRQQRQPQAGRNPGFPGGRWSRRLTPTPTGFTRILLSAPREPSGRYGFEISPIGVPMRERAYCAGDRRR